MAAAPYPRLGGEAATGGRFAATLAILREEFALRPHRLRSSIRAATIGALGAGLVAALHIDTPLGAYLIWALAASPVAMMRWRAAVALALIEAVVVALALVFARAFSQSPVLMLAAIGLFGTASTYVIGRHRLGTPGLITQVLVYDTLYGVMFAPDQVGWSSAATFDGVALALGLIVLFDNWFWPDPAEAILVELIADNLKRVRANLSRAAEAYLAGDTSMRESLARHDLGATLALFTRAQAEGLPSHRRGVLLAAITRLSRLRSLANEMLVANDPRVAHRIRQVLAPEVRSVIGAIDRTLAAMVESPVALLRSGYDPLPAAQVIGAALAAMDARITVLRPVFDQAPSEELANLSSFLSCIRRVARLIDRPLDDAAEMSPLQPPSPPSTASVDPRYCLKVGLALVVGYVIGLASQRADLSTIMTTIIITVLPTYGAAARKMILRLVGAIIGGGAVVLTVIMVSPNFETVPAYMLAVFAVLLISSYAGQGSERVAYAGKQLGTTFILAFIGLSPTTAVEPPLWRVWAILIGTAISLVVSLVLWPEYAGESLGPRLGSVLRLTLALAPGVARDRDTLHRCETELNSVLEQVLAIADDARLEGHAGSLSADAVVDVAGTLRRMAHRFETIAFQRIEAPRPALDRQSEDAESAALAAVISQLESLRAWLDAPAGLANPPPDASLNQGTLSQAVADLNARVEADGFALVRDWPLEQRRTLFIELESMRRLVILMAELEDGLRRLRLL
jgi:uncharacterized membrane protein YccC